MSRREEERLRSLIGTSYGKPKPKATGTPYVPPKPPTAPPQQIPYMPPQQQQNYYAQQAQMIQAQQQAAALAAQQRAAQIAAQQRAAQIAAQQKAQYDRFMEQERAAQAKRKQEPKGIPGMAGWYPGATLTQDVKNVGAQYGKAIRGIGETLGQGSQLLGQTVYDFGKLQSGWQVGNLAQPYYWSEAMQPGAGRGIEGMGGWHAPAQDVYGYAQQINRNPWLTDRTGGYPGVPGWPFPEQQQQRPGPYQGQMPWAFRQRQYGPPAPYWNPAGPRGQKGPYTPQDERQWVIDREAQTVGMYPPEGLFFGLPEQEAPLIPTGGVGWPGGGGGGGYAGGTYGSRPNAGLNYANQAKNWYEKMLQWRI